MTDALAQTLTLPCGARLPNRLAKAAMTEGLADINGVPTPELERLYGLWSNGGAGMLLSGNVQIDAQHLERPGNVVIDGEPDEELRRALAAWAKAGTRNGNHFWAQISHVGRQTQKAVNPHPKAPSAVKVGLPGGQFGQPVELTAAEIADIVRRFGICAAAVREAGFTGVQVAQWLEQAGVDLIEISGSTYEQPKLLGITGVEEEEKQNVAQSTMIREAYFVDFAVAMREKLSVPLMVTGGFRKRAAMEQALASGGADPDISVFAATRKLMKMESQFLKKRARAR